MPTKSYIPMTEFVTPSIRKVVEGILQFDYDSMDPKYVGWNADKALSDSGGANYEDWVAFRKSMKFFSSIPPSTFLSLRLAKFISARLGLTETPSLLYNIYLYLEQNFNSRASIALDQDDFDEIVLGLSSLSRIYKAPALNALLNDAYEHYHGEVNSQAECRVLEAPIYLEDTDVVPASYHSNRLLLHLLMEYIYEGGLISASEPASIAHLQNSLVKTWLSIHQSISHMETKDAWTGFIYRHARKLFDGLFHGRGPSAADFVGLSLGSILSYEVVDWVKLNASFIGLRKANFKSRLEDTFLYFCHTLNDTHITDTELRSKLLDGFKTLNLKTRRGANLTELVNKLMRLLWLHVSLKSELDSPDKGNVRVLNLTDSVGAGFGLLKEVRDNTYIPGRSATMQCLHSLRGSGHRVDISNVALVGATSLDGSARIMHELTYNCPDVVILTLGGNDAIMLNGASGAEICGFIAEQWKLILQSCFEYNSHMQVVVGLRIPESDLFGDHAGINALIKTELVDRVKAYFTAKQQEAIHYVEVPEGAFKADKLLSDNIHLNAEAHSLLAEFVAESLSPLVRGIEAKIPARNDVLTKVAQQRMLVAASMNAGLVELAPGAGSAISYGDFSYLFKACTMGVPLPTEQVAASAGASALVESFDEVFADSRDRIKLQALLA